MAINRHTLIKRIEALEAARERENEEDWLATERERLILAIQLSAWGLESLPLHMHFVSDPPHYGMPRLEPIRSNTDRR